VAQQQSAKADTDHFDVAPFVLVVDESESMKFDNAIDTVNAWVPDLIRAVRDVPEAMENAAIGIIGFSSESRFVRRMSWLDDDITVPHFKTDGQTSFAKPLQACREMLLEDVPRLGHRGFRPVIFFITDGKPNVEVTEVWMAARRELLDLAMRPKIVTFGFGATNDKTLSALASEPGLAEYNSHDPQQALAEILKIVIRTIVKLTQGGVSTEGGLVDKILGTEGPEVVDYDE
jgi:uncharacterized protein YegL